MDKTVVVLIIIALTCEGLISGILGYLWGRMGPDAAYERGYADGRWVKGMKRPALESSTARRKALDDMTHDAVEQGLYDDAVEIPHTEPEVVVKRGSGRHRAGVT